MSMHGKKYVQGYNYLIQWYDSARKAQIIHSITCSICWKEMYATTMASTLLNALLFVTFAAMVTASDPDIIRDLVIPENSSITIEEFLHPRRPARSSIETTHQTLS